MQIVGGGGGEEGEINHTYPAKPFPGYLLPFPGYPCTIPDDPARKPLESQNASFIRLCKLFHIFNRTSGTKTSGLNPYVLTETE